MADLPRLPPARVPGSHGAGFPSAARARPLHRGRDRRRDDGDGVLHDVQDDVGCRVKTARFVLAMPFRFCTFILAGIGTALVVVSVGFEMAWRGIEG